MKQTIKIIKKASAPQTLRSIRKSQSVVISTRDILESTVRSAASRLKKEGFRFICNATISGTEVIRIK